MGGFRLWGLGLVMAWAALTPAAFGEEKNNTPGGPITSYVVALERPLVEGTEAILLSLAPESVVKLASHPLVEGLTVLRLGLTVAMILVLIGFRFLVDGWFVRWLKKTAEPPGSLPNLLLKALHRPLVLMLWAFGLYAALWPVLDVIPGPWPLVRWASHVADLIGLWAVFGFVYRLVVLANRRITERAATSENRFERVLIPLVARVVRVVIPLLAILLTVPIIDFPESYSKLISSLITILVIGVITWMLLQAANACEALMLAGHNLDEADNLQARRIFTQVHVLKKVAISGILVLGVASMLMVFPSVRQFGGSILASAGIVGIIIGIAAQRSLANIIAGFQIAITQPIRIEDAVVVEGEWGWVEEITLTYVVIRIWDWRRLVLPITYFVEKPFQNWTRTAGTILGSVFLYVDYTLPLEPLRKRLDEVLENTPLWDRQAKVLQVTDSREHVMELRILCSGKDSPTTWDLRCHVREEMIDFIRREYPQSLPRLRAELDRVPPESTAQAG